MWGIRVRSFRFAYAVLAFLSFIGAGGAGNKYVSVRAEIDQSDHEGSECGRVQFTLTPEDGIHINADPPVEFSLRENSPFVLDGDLYQHADPHTGYLSTSSPMTQNFHCPDRRGEGDSLLEGTLVYYYCSDEDGWCMKYSQPITLAVAAPK